MTLQLVPLLSDLVLLGGAALVVVLFAVAAVHLGRRRPHPAAATSGAAVALVLIYGAVLVAVGLSSTPTQLRPGDAKCYDDWCAAVMGARQAGEAGPVLVAVQLQNRGRGRAMRSDLARAYLELPGGRVVAPSDGSPLQTFLEPGQRVNVELAFPAVGGLRGTRVVIVEGGGGLSPGNLEIGGEFSPFHSKAGWPL